MRLNNIKVKELAGNYINGNKSDVRKEVKKLTKLEFCALVIEICELLGSENYSFHAYLLTL